MKRASLGYEVVEKTEDTSKEIIGGYMKSYTLLTEYSKNLITKYSENSITK